MLLLVFIRMFLAVAGSPERHFKGKDLEQGTGIENAQLDGAHLRLPGYDGDGPTLEVFTYNVLDLRPSTSVNRPGLGHIAFVVEDVEKGKEEVLAAGGNAVGEIVTLEVSTGAKVTWCYVTDPEGNVIELQSWSK